MNQWFLFPVFGLQIDTYWDSFGRFPIEPAGKWLMFYSIDFCTSPMNSRYPRIFLRKRIICAFPAQG